MLDALFIVGIPGSRISVPTLLVNLVQHLGYIVVVTIEQNNVGYYLRRHEEETGLCNGIWVQQTKILFAVTNTLLFLPIVSIQG